MLKLVATLGFTVVASQEDLSIMNITKVL
jgi:hypothetical protein